mmetsp:Transcript_34078/g.67156  ORF Transcript_34078/g.67156 Transcript_34078/m.67156 type:complete len:82 (+) Transcript_34078:2239-2484(+)
MVRREQPMPEISVIATYSNTTQASLGWVLQLYNIFDRQSHIKVQAERSTLAVCQEWIEQRFGSKDAIVHDYREVSSTQHIC